jgi:hypothetical protein
MITERDYYPWDCQGYSSNSGAIVKIDINEGWNLIPRSVPFRECYYALENELCTEDVLISYLYNSKLNIFVKQDLNRRASIGAALKNYLSSADDFKLKKPRDGYMLSLDLDIKMPLQILVHTFPIEKIISVMESIN